MPDLFKKVNIVQKTYQEIYLECFHSFFNNQINKFSVFYMTVAIGIAFIGIFLIYLEFFLPGAIMGFAGGILILVSLIVFFTKMSSLIAFVFFLLGILLVLYIAIQLALKQVRLSGKKNTVLLSSDQEGYQASHYDKFLIGKKGISVSDLKPSGHVRIEKKEYQALSKRGYIVKNSPVEVIGGQGTYLLVQIVNNEKKQ